MYDLTPDWEQLTREVLFGQIWQDDRLSKRDRSLATVAMLMAQRAETALAGHMQRALSHGVTVDELKALITHSAFYCGWTAPETAIRVLHAVIQEYGVHDKPCTRLCCQQ